MRPLRDTKIVLFALVLFLSTFADVRAQDRTWRDNAIQTTLYFGLRTPGGETIGEQAWLEYLRDVVTPRFPDGLTVVQAYGRSRGDPVGAASRPAATTRILIVVRPDTPAAARNVERIKSEFRRKFSGARVFHTETAVRVVD